MTKIVVYLLIGRLIIHAFQVFPFKKLPFIGKFFLEGRALFDLISCDFCIGFWVYSFLDFCFQINYLNEYLNIPIVSYFLTGLISSFIMHLIRIGWTTKFSTIVLE